MKTSTIFALATLFVTPAAFAEVVSHPPLRKTPAVANRPLENGVVYFVNSAQGDDAADGSKENPWKTIQRAADSLKAGDTLVLRGGVYYENVSLSLKGTPEKPITIRAYPGESATIDAAWREFFESPASAWEPVPGSKIGEYRSTRQYPNQRNVLGSFGDSMIGLQSYYHAQDLRAEGEVVDWIDWDNQAEKDIKPLYCGPGVWHDPVDGRIYARLADTHLPDPCVNYRGETDPRKVPLLLAPFRATPLRLDAAEHLRFQDITIRGAGYAAVEIDQSVGIEFDNVTVYAGTYGLRLTGVRHLKFLHSRLYGNVAPWTFRADGSKRDYPGRPYRNLSRLNTHALVEIYNGGESSVYATPQSDFWEFAHSEFTDAHDAVYFASVNGSFHHNLVDNMQDDGLYLSPMYLRHRLDQKDPRIDIYQNTFRGVLTSLAFGGTELSTSDQFFIYRNLFDHTVPIPTGRATAKKPEASFSFGKPIGDHGSPPWPAMTFYHNTFVCAEAQRDAAMATLGASKTIYPRRVFNNLYLHQARLPGYSGPDPAANAVEDGNLFWSPGADAAAAEKFFTKYRASETYAASKAIHPAGSSTNSQVGDPKVGKNYLPGAGSAAKDAGIDLPADWPDPVRKTDAGKPDIGAFPVVP